MPFELTNAPTASIDFMNRVFKLYLNKFRVAFIDDILIYSKDKDEHTKHIKIILQILRDHQLYASYQSANFS